MPLYTFLHNLLNVLVQIASKMGLQKNHEMLSYRHQRLVFLSRCHSGLAGPDLLLPANNTYSYPQG
jgi:hypothetical protein